MYIHIYLSNYLLTPTFWIQYICIFIFFSVLLSDNPSIFIFLYFTHQQHPIYTSRFVYLFIYPIYKRNCILENIRQEIYAKIGVRVNVYRQLWIPVLLLLFFRTLQYGDNFAFVFTQKGNHHLTDKPDVYSLLLQILCLSPPSTRV